MDELRKIEADAREAEDAWAKDATIAALRQALAELLDSGEWTWSESDDQTVYSIHLTYEHYSELEKLLS